MGLVITLQGGPRRRVPMEADTEGKEKLLSHIFSSLSFGLQLDN